MMMAAGKLKVEEGVGYIVAQELGGKSANIILGLGSFALSIACQMFIPLIAICYFSWFTKQGVTLGIVVGINQIVWCVSKQWKVRPRFKQANAQIGVFAHPTGYGTA